MSYPNTQTLSSEEKDLVWQYRFYLSANKKALAKFVKCVDWNTKTEANQALDLVRLDINLHLFQFLTKTSVSPFVRSVYSRH